MFTEANVRFLVSTYELPEKLSKKLIAIVWREAKEGLFAVNFDALYTRVAELVEKFELKYSEKRVLRLDAPIDGINGNDFYSIIKYNEKPEEKNNPIIPNMRIEDIIGILSSQLDAAQMQVLHYLAFQAPKDNLLFLKPEQILSSIPQISSRLEQAVKLYEKDGRIVMPKRPIVYIKWNPKFWVKFGQRRFNGNPAAFFRENGEAYGGMKRNELRLFDPGLYKALRETGQLTEVIPERYKSGLKPEIVKLYSATNGNASAIARKLRIAKDTVLKALREEHLEIRSNTDMNGRGLTAEQITEVTVAYDTFKGSSFMAAQSLPYDSSTFLKYWKIAGKKTRRPGEHN